MNKYGVLLINKPVGITSFRIVQILRKITGIKKIGHTGTLDPFASGLLPVCVGKATRTVDLLSSKDKTYKAKIKLGEKTDSGDIDGKIIERDEIPQFSEDTFRIIAQKMLQIIQQTPPKYSAKKINGQRAYVLARKNQQFELKPVPVKISEFNIGKINLPFLTYISTVSKGTYIRTLSETFAELCGTIATTVELKRIRIGDLKIEDSVNIDELTHKNWSNYLIDLKDIFTDYPKIIIQTSNIKKISHGNEVETELDDAERVIILNEANNCIGIGSVAEKILKPKLVFV